MGFPESQEEGCDGDLKPGLALSLGSGSLYLVPSVPGLLKYLLETFKKQGDFCVCVCCMYKPEVNTDSLYCSPPCSLRQNLSLNLELLFILV